MKNFKDNNYKYPFAPKEYKEYFDWNAFLFGCRVGMVITLLIVIIIELK